MKSSLPIIYNCANDEEFIINSIAKLVKCVDKVLNIDNQDDCIIALSGGLTPLPLYQYVVQNIDKFDQIDWKKVVFILVDERFVPFEHNLSNSKNILQIFLAQQTENQFSFTKDQFIFPDTSLPIEECIEQYQKRLSTLKKNIDICILGFGEDAHIASWFPPFYNELFKLSHDKNILVHKTHCNNNECQTKITISMHMICQSNEKLFLINDRKKSATIKNLLEKYLIDDKIYNSQPALQALMPTKLYHDKGPAMVILHPALEQDSHDIGTLNIIIFGASGNLTKTKIMPAIYCLYLKNLLPLNFYIHCYCRSAIDKIMFVEELKNIHIYESEKISNECEGLNNYQNNEIIKNEIIRDEIMESLSYKRNLFTFLNRIFTFQCTSYDSEESMHELIENINNLHPNNQLNQTLLYFALPPHQYLSTIITFSKGYDSLKYCDKPDWSRVIIEKPFGTSFDTASQLLSDIFNMVHKKNIFLIDHYLGKEIILNLIKFRFENYLMSNILNSNHVDRIFIQFNEARDCGDQIMYFNTTGIIKDVVQNHVLQTITYLTMDLPDSYDCKNIQAKKVDLLKAIEIVLNDKLVIGQYKDGHNTVAYNKLENVDDKSQVPTYVFFELRINNSTWSSVPIYVEYGKAMKKSFVEARYILKTHPSLPNNNINRRNEIVIKIQPIVAYTIKLVTGEIDENIKSNNKNIELIHKLQNPHSHKIRLRQNPYERLIAEAIIGNHSNFVTQNEVLNSWNIIDKLLYHIESNSIEVEYYEPSSLGPPTALQHKQNLNLL